MKMAPEAIMQLGFRPDRRTVLAVRSPRYRCQARMYDKRQRNCISLVNGYPVVFYH